MVNLDDLNIPSSKETCLNFAHLCALVSYDLNNPDIYDCDIYDYLVYINIAIVKKII